MKIHRIIFKIIFVVYIFLSIGPNISSDIIIHPFNIEHYKGSQVAENSFIADVVSFDDDQIDMAENAFEDIEPVYPISVHQKVFPTTKTSTSVWQPPNIF